LLLHMSTTRAGLRTDILVPVANACYLQVDLKGAKSATPNTWSPHLSLAAKMTPWKTLLSSRMLKR